LTPGGKAERLAAEPEKEDVLLQARSEKNLNEDED
jgi:hypothetical protein